MKRSVSASVAFYVGIISIIVGMISRAFNFTIAGVMPHNFIHFANMWFLISIVILLQDIAKNTSK